MEYIRFIGEFDDMPFERFATQMRASYARMLNTLEQERAGKA
jgi:hypothetical protein